MPLPGDLVVKNGSKIRSIVAGAMPCPVSSTATQTYGPGRSSPWLSTIA